MGILHSLFGSVEPAYLTVNDARSLRSAGMPSVLGMASGALAGGAASAPPGDAMRLKVHFNPSEFRLKSKNKVIHKNDAQSGNGGVQSQSDTVTAPVVTMYVDLIFDDVNISDAFMFDKFTNTSIKNIASTVATVLGKKRSVQTEVEGLIATLRDPLTRRITFSWGTFTFTGDLIKVSAKYTMFSTSGRPIRAVVSLKASQIINEKLLKSWYDDYQSAFGGSLFGKVSGMLGSF